MTSIKSLIPLQRKVEVSGKKINSHLESSTRHRFQAEVDVRPSLALPSTTPTRQSAVKALNRLQKASNSVAGARKEIEQLNTHILQKQTIPIVDDHSLPVKGVPKGWELYNSTCASLANQRDLYNNAVEKEGGEVSGFTQRISSGGEAQGFLQRLNSTIQELQRSPENNNTQTSQNRTAPNDSTTRRTIGFLRS